VPNAVDIVTRSNQRGGRMLSVLDLLDARTLTLEQCAWLLARVAEGSSWLVGARPGGAGKTTIMGALLAMLPEGESVHLAGEGPRWRHSGPGECVVAYEIGRGGWEGYVWAEDLRALAGLGERGCRIVTNLHADTLAEAREQIVGQNRVPESAFDGFELFLPIRLTGSGRGAVPVVPTIWRHTEAGWTRLDEPELGPEEERIRAWLVGALAGGARTIQEVRAAWLRFRTEV
jgi:hypothetical protein